MGTIERETDAEGASQKIILIEGRSLHAPVEPAAEAAKIAMIKEEVQAFVLDNAYKIQAGYACARCVDGRYNTEDAREAPLSVPGADAGYAMAAFAALKKLNIAVDQNEVWDKVVEAAGGEENFYFHTDDHHLSDGAGKGCGHLNLANGPEGESKYGVTADEMVFIFQKLDTLASKRPANQKILQGDHLERAVLVVDSGDYAVAPMQPAENSRPNEAFVFHQTLHNIRMKKLAGLLMQIPEVSAVAGLEKLSQVLEDAFQMQLNSTLDILAAGDPKFSVTERSGAWEVSKSD